MPTAQSLMETAPTVSPSLSVQALAERLLADNLDGVCVVEDGDLVGVVTAMDLVFTQRVVQAPTAITLFELVIPIGVRRAEKQLQKATATTVRALMSTDLVTATPDTKVAEIAGWMVDRHLTLVPVLQPGTNKLLGVLTKDLLVRHVLKAAAGRSAPS